MEVDVAVIGAGPAGSTLAAMLASRGARVALIDRDRFPRDKLCGEFLSYDALPVLRPLGIVDALDAAGVPEIHRCRVVGPRGVYEFELPRAARGVSRLLLDELLVRVAANRGASCLEGAAASGLKRSSGESRHTIVLDDDSEIRCRVVVGAWGRWGRLDRQLERGFVHERARRNFGFKRHYVAAGARDRTAIELHSFRRGYLGVNAVESGNTNVCGLVHADRLSGHKGRWDAFVETIRSEEIHLDRLFGSLLPAQEGFLSSEPVIFRARSVVEDGVFMIGDASGMIDPLTGNGMAMAVQSALLAAPIVLRVAEDPLSRAVMEERYRREHRAFFASRIAWSRRAAILLSRPRLLEAAMSAVRSPRIGELLLRRTRAEYEEVEQMAEGWWNGR